MHGYLGPGVHITNGISIGSSVLAGLSAVTNAQTDRLTDKAKQSKAKEVFDEGAGRILYVPNNGTRPHLMLRVAMRPNMDNLQSHLSKNSRVYEIHRESCE